MVTLNRIYTRGGDDGMTSLGDGERIAKHSARIEAIGAVDEANAVIGVARLAASDAPAIDGMLMRIQHDLFDLGADLCIPDEGTRSEGALRIIPGQVERLEQEIDSVNARLQPLQSFVLPGGSALAAHLHVARTVTRRAERAVTLLSGVGSVNPDAVKYLNRLSDHLFVLARHANEDGTADVLWRPGANRLSDRPD
jgi:cob(I)alamin adenosyltransferase